jgi:hypothetical protein
MTLLTFLSLQLDRLNPKPVVHAPGPKRPTLAQVEAEKGGK